MKHKLTLLLLALIGSTGAWATNVTFNLGDSGNLLNGSFYKDGVYQNNGWCDKVYYGLVTLTGSISRSTGYIDVIKYGSTSLTISVPTGTTIKGYSFDIKISEDGATSTCTANNGSSYELNYSTPVTIAKSDLNTTSTTINFTATADSRGECILALSNFTVTLETNHVESLKADGYYYIHNFANSDKYASSDYTCTTTGSRQLFKISRAIRGGDECYTIYNMSTRKFIKYAGNSNGAVLSGDDAGDNSYWTITFDGTKCTICPKGTSDFSWNFYGGLTDGNPLKLFGINDRNSKWLLEEATSLTSYAIDGDYEFYTVTNNRSSDKVVSSAYLCATSNPGVFCIQKVSGQSYYTIYNVSSNKYVNWTDANSGANKLTEADNTSSNSYWDILDQLDSNNIIATICPHGTTTLSWNFYGGASDGTAIGLYSNTDGGSTWRLTKQTYNATYKLFYNNTEMTDVNGTVVFKKVNIAVGSLMPTSLMRDFCTYDYYSNDGLTAELSTLPSSDVTVYVKVNWGGPFEISADYASAHWYDMAMRRNWYVTSDQEDENGALLTVEANAIGLGGNAYQWAFVGDPYHVQLYNKDKGSSVVFNATGVITNEGIPTFSAGPYYWKIVRSTTSIPNAFLLNAPNTDCYINQFGGAGGSLKFWNHTNNLSDEGSAFTVLEVPTDYSEFAAAEIQPYATPTGYFAFTDDVKAAIGWNDSYATVCPYATYKAMKLALLAIDLSDMSNYNLPETGYYRFKSKYYDTYMGLTTDKVLDNFSENSAATIVKLTEGTGDNAGKYTIALQDRYIQTPTQSEAVPLTDNAASAEWFTPTVVEIGYGSFGDADASVSDGYSYVHAASSGGTTPYYVVGWVANAEASKWTIEDADKFDLTIGETGYSTLWVPFAVTIPDGVEAYTGSRNGEYLHLNEVEGETLPAGTAVVLKGSDSGDYTFDLAADVSAIAGNVLLGSNGSVVGSGNGIYALSKKDNTVGFYPVGTNETSVRIPANKAYLNTGGGSIKGFTFEFDEEDDDPTGIESIQNSSQSSGAGGTKFKIQNEEPVYNLAGQRVDNSQFTIHNSQLKRGIYIVNGKKFLK